MVDFSMSGFLGVGHIDTMAPGRFLDIIISKCRMSNVRRKSGGFSWRMLLALG